MKNYVVGIVNLLDSELFLYNIKTEDEYLALKEALILNLGNNPDAIEDLINHQKEDYFPKTAEDLIDYYIDADMLLRVIEVN